MRNMGNLKIGAIVEYETFGGGKRRVILDEVSDDIKNGRPGFGGEIVTGPDRGMSVWGYADQITRVVAEDAYADDDAAILAGIARGVEAGIFTVFNPSA